ncbi:MAG: GNAT family N-acetyltransferase [Pelagimonas sp.]|jgi:CelD/BcsL family acetyltransferase involved in cellulose biosynthesis|nr:GNAT family N-acetyltransferase [Pelagimonas sp.]
MSPDAPLARLQWDSAPAMTGPPAPTADPTTSDPWLALWQRHFGTPEDLSLQTNRTRLPLTREQRRGARVWRSFTNGHSQRSLANPPQGPDALDLLTRIKAQRGWDMLHLQGLHPDWARDLTQAAGVLGLVAKVEHEVQHLFTDLGEAPQSYLERLSGSGFKRLAKSERALNRVTPVSFHQDDPASTIDAYLAAEHHSWKAQQGELLTHDQATTGFYRDLSRMPGTQMFTLRSADQILGGFLTYGHDSHVVCLKTFYDTAFQKYSVGSLIIRNVLLHLLDQGFAGRVDFYSDRAGYARFATGQARYVDLVIWARHPRAYALRQMRDALQRHRQQ